MFTLENTLSFYNVETDYVEALYRVDSEVFYKPYGYENKPYIGILLVKGTQKYVIPMTSAKPKHKRWKDIDSDRLLITEIADKNHLGCRDVWKRIPKCQDGSVRHIMSAIDLKKMIPVTDSVLTPVDINPNTADSPEEKSYKALLTKEYRACIRLKDSILERASVLYDLQIETGEIIPFCCDFRLLEQACLAYAEQSHAQQQPALSSFSDQLRSAQEKAAALNAQRQTPRSSITREVPEK